MRAVVETFDNLFHFFGLRLPVADVVHRRAGQICHNRWFVDYVFGKDEHGEYAEFYAAHPMTSDQHFRIYTDGTMIDGLGTIDRVSGTERQALLEDLVTKGFSLFREFL